MQATTLHEPDTQKQASCIALKASRAYAMAKKCSAELTALIKMAQAHV